jgi:hypothetical protein
MPIVFTNYYNNIRSLSQNIYFSMQIIFLRRLDDQRRNTGSPSAYRSGDENSFEYPFMNMRCREDRG